MKERILAVCAVVLLVALAVVARDALAGDDGGDGSGGGSGGGGDGGLVAACTPDLRSLCDALADAGEVAPDPLVLDAGIDAADERTPDVWLTWDPAPQVANAGTTSGPEPWGEPVALGSAELAVLLEPADRDALAGACGTIDWACLATEADRTVAVGVGDPATAEGIARLRPLAEALTTDRDPSQLDSLQLQALVDSPVNGQDEAASMIQARVRRTTDAVVVGPRGRLDDIQSSAQGSRLVVEVPAPTATITLVVAPRADAGIGADELDGWCEVLADELTALGLAPCEGTPTDDPQVAGFLYQVREKAT